MTDRLATIAAGACAALLLAAAPALAAQPCKTDDLTGVWSLKSIHAEQPGVQAFYSAHPVEYLRFRADGKYDYVAMNQPLMGLAAISASLDRADVADGVTLMGILMNEAGVLILMRDGEAFEGFMCAMDGPAMVWTEIEGNPPLRRVQVRVR